MWNSRQSRALSLIFSGAALAVAASAKGVHPALGVQVSAVSEAAAAVLEEEAAVSGVSAVLEEEAAVSGVSAVASWPFSTPAAETVRSRMQRMQVR